MQSSFAAMRDVLQPNTLLMDVGSTKCDVIAAAMAALGDRLSCFVPAHPITGKEVAGVEHADVKLYPGAQVVLTPPERTLTAHLAKAQALWQALGCKVTAMSPETHDSALATVSHLPHLLAFAMMQSVLSQPGADDMLALAGPGFRDFTRIGAGDPKLWRDVLLANRDQVLAQSRQFRQALEQLEGLMQANDGQGLQDRLTLASAARAEWTMGGKRGS
jgi:prephenate dehydrogenase